MPKQARICSCGFRGLVAAFISACQFDPFWWSQRREPFETVNAVRMWPLRKLSRKFSRVTATIPAARHGGIST